MFSSVKTWVGNSALKGVHYRVSLVLHRHVPHYTLHYTLHTQTLHTEH